MRLGKENDDISIKAISIQKEMNNIYHNRFVLVFLPDFNSKTY